MNEQMNERGKVWSSCACSKRIWILIIFFDEMFGYVATWRDYALCLYGLCIQKLLRVNIAQIFYGLNHKVHKEVELNDSSEHKREELILCLFLKVPTAPR